jgi:hypothetical protein
MSPELSNFTVLLNAFNTFEAPHSDAEVRLCCPLLDPLSRGETEAERATNRLPLGGTIGFEMGILAEKAQDLECNFLYSP